MSVIRSRAARVLLLAVVPISGLACSDDTGKPAASSSAASPSAPAASSSGTATSPSAATSAPAAAAGGCPDVVATAKAAVDAATDPAPKWTGPTDGPKAVAGKTVMFVAQTLQNPGVAGAAKGFTDAAEVIGLESRVIDGQGTPAGIQAAFSSALALNPDGIVIGGFDPNSTKELVDQANAKNIPLIGWHAVGTAGPSTDPKMFSNVTTSVEDVAKISADYVIAKSNGIGGVVIFTDSSIPFAENKSQLIRKELETCADLKVLSYSNIPIPDATTRTPQEVNSLLQKNKDTWTWSLAINDLYYEAAAPALKAGGRSGTDAPNNVAAGDGDPASFERIRSKSYQTATVPEPLLQQGWQIVDEFNRAFSNAPATGYSAPVHVTDANNVTDSQYWDPANGYQDIYKKIWGK